MPGKLNKLLFAACFALYAISMTGCSGKEETAEPVAKQTIEPTLAARNLEVIFSDSGKIQARLTGIVFNRFTGNNPYLEFPKGFRVEFYDSVLHVETVISGNYGKRYENSRLMLAKGNVIVRNEVRKQQLNTEELFWDENTRRIYTPDAVKITTPDKILYGKGLESNEAFTKYKITQVSGQMMVNKDSI